MTDFDDRDGGRPAPPTKLGTKMTSGRIYVLETTSHLGPKEPIRGQAFSTPHAAYRRIVEHAGQEPTDGEPDWPDSFGERYWGWKPDDGSVGYVLSEWEWAGREDPDDAPFPPEPDVPGGADDR